MKLHFYTYNLPFKHVFSTAAKKFSYREGLCIELQKDGLRSLGEVAPLPGFSVESLEDVKKQLKTLQPAIFRFFDAPFSLKDISHFLESHHFYPSVQFGLYSLAIFFLAQKKGCSAHHLLFDDPQSNVPVNAVLGLETDHYEQRVQKYIEQGFN